MKSEIRIALQRKAGQTDPLEPKTPGLQPGGRIKGGAPFLEAFVIFFEPTRAWQGKPAKALNLKPISHAAAPAGR